MARRTHDFEENFQRFKKGKRKKSEEGSSRGSKKSLRKHRNGSNRIREKGMW